MALDKQALQRELDLAAEELDRTGHTDLANKVDRFCQMLMSAKDMDLPVIHRGLTRIQNEYEKRMAADTQVQPRAAKAQAAVLAARRSSIQRKIAIKRLLRERAAKRENELSRVKAAASATKSVSPIKQRLDQRVSEAEHEMQAAKNRIARLQRIQSQLK